MNARVRNLLAGDRRTIARIISEVENSPLRASEIVRTIFRYTGRAYVIGVTGPPGCGKSSLIEKMALELRKKDKRIGVIAVDPSSPYTGGAFMGNRVRMSEAAKDSRIFIRSMASRGSLGGLSRAVSDTIKILDSAGMDYVIIETVGAGQLQTDIAKNAFTTVVVFQPETGDIIQAMKAGIMEIGDIFVVNKSDLVGADKTVRFLAQAVEFKTSGNWQPRIIKTIATRRMGISELIKAIEEHKEYLLLSNKLVDMQKEFLKNEIEKIVEEKLRQRISKGLRKPEIQSIINDAVARKVSTYAAADRLVRKLGRRTN